MNLSSEEIIQALAEKYPDRKFHTNTIDDMGSADVIVSSDAEYDSLVTQLRKKEEELKESDATCSKALTSIQTFHKHQRDLFDEFVVLRQKYDEQRTLLMTVLWQHCSQHHPELRHIPPLEDPEKFVESDEQVGAYTIGPILGEGQFASVYTCEKQGAERIGVELALKSVKKERIMSFHGLKRMSNEIKTLRMLQSDYIVCIHDVFQTASKLYIVTEKGGPDLFEFFDEHPEGVPEEWAKEIILRVMRAVQFCHDRQYCHRDLKPENILMNFDPNTHICSDLKLCDFGLSIQFKEKMILSDFCGSPGFFAPEMITKGAYYGDKADIWSTGCILLELILGHEQFCDIWMCAYDYDILQDKEKFAESIEEAVASLPEKLSFSEHLPSFVEQFVRLRASERPAIKDLLGHKWLASVYDKNRTSSYDLTLNVEGSFDASGSEFGSPISMNFSPEPITRGRFDSLDSPHRNLTVNTANGAFSPESVVGTDEWNEKQRALVKESYSDRERQMLENYSKHKIEKDDDRVYHLPPIEPPTPSLSRAKKILVKGDNLAKLASKGEINMIAEEGTDLDDANNDKALNPTNNSDQMTKDSESANKLQRIQSDTPTEESSDASTNLDAPFGSLEHQSSMLRSQSDRPLS